MNSQPTHAGFKLKSTGQADIIKAGGDVGKSMPTVLSPTPPEPAVAAAPPFSNTTISKSETRVAAAKSQTVPAEQESSDPKRAKESLDAEQQEEVPGQPSSPNAPVWSAGNMKLKATAKGDDLKSGKDIHYQAFKPKPFEDMTPKEREKALRRRAKRKAKAEARAAKLAAEAESKPPQVQDEGAFTIYRKFPDSSKEELHFSSCTDDNQIAAIAAEAKSNQTKVQEEVSFTIYRKFPDSSKEELHFSSCTDDNQNAAVAAEAKSNPTHVQEEAAFTIYRKFPDSSKEELRFSSCTDDNQIATVAAEAKSKPTHIQEEAAFSIYRKLPDSSKEKLHFSSCTGDIQVAAVATESKHEKEELPTPNMNNIHQNQSPSSFSSTNIGTKQTEKAEAKVAQTQNAPAGTDQVQSRATTIESTENMIVESEPQMPNIKNNTIHSYGPSSSVSSNQNKAAYAGFKLKRTGQAATIMAGGDVVKEKMLKSAVEERTSPFNKLKSTSQNKTLESGGNVIKTASTEIKEPVMAPHPQMEEAKGEHCGEANNIPVQEQPRQKPPKKKEEKQAPSSLTGMNTKVTATPKPPPAYAGFKLKSTGQAYRLKAGGDVIKESQHILQDKSEHASFIGFKLKKAGSGDNNENKDKEKQTLDKPSVSSSMVLKDRSINIASSVGLKPLSKKSNKEASGNLTEPMMQENVKPAMPSKNMLTDESTNASFSGLKLKNPGHAGTTTMENKLPQPKAGVVKPPMKKEAQPEQAMRAGKPAYAGFKLKSTGYGDAVMSGGDVEAPKKSFEGSNEYGKVQLKKVGTVH